MSENADLIFAIKLEQGWYKTAFDPISHRYVRISRIDKDDNGRLTIVAHRFCDSVLYKFGIGQLTHYTN